MRLKKVFAGFLAAAMMVTAVSVPAFAAESVDEENGLFDSTYVMMNIPYDEFYKAVGVNNSSSVDAVSSATKSKTRAALAKGSYHVNSDGSDITGVTFPVKVIASFGLNNYKEVTDNDSFDITVKLRGKDTTTTYSGVNALFENPSYSYYKLSETPAYYVDAWYNILTGKFEFGKINTNVTTVEGVTTELTTNGRHTDYEITHNGFEVDTTNNTIYGAVITTDDGAQYGLRHVYEIWRGTEIGFDVGEGNEYYAAIVGKTITNITYYTAQGVYSLPVNVAIPALS